MADLPATEQRVQVDYLKRGLETGITMANLVMSKYSIVLKTHCMLVRCQSRLTR